MPPSERQATPIPKGKPKPKIPTKTALLKRCDAVFGQIIRSRGACENCSKTSDLQCAHGFSRRYRAVRWDERNAFCLCRGCHLFFTHRPLEWDLELTARMGRKFYEVLRYRALYAPNPDLSSELVRLRARLADIEREVA